MSALKLFNRRKARVRFKFKKTADRLRLTVYRSNCHIYAQIIDDANQVTLTQASTVDKDLAKDLKKTSDVSAAKVVGKLLADRAKKLNIDKVFFDRGGYLYHGRVKALADAAREGGLQF